MRGSSFLAEQARANKKLSFDELMGVSQLDLPDICASLAQQV